MRLSLICVTAICGGALVGKLANATDIAPTVRHSRSSSIKTWCRPAPSDVLTTSPRQHGVKPQKIRRDDPRFQTAAVVQGGSENTVSLSK